MVKFNYKEIKKKNYVPDIQTLKVGKTTELHRKHFKGIEKFYGRKH